MSRIDAERQDAGGGFGPEGAPVQRRLSLAAVFSMVIGIVAVLGCCAPGPILGLVGIPLGVFGLIAVSKSQGQLGGRNAAVAGLALNMVAMFAGAIIWLMGVQAVGEYTSKSVVYGRFVQEAQNADPSGLVEILTPQAAQKADPAAIAAFRARTLETLGEYKSVETGWVWASAVLATGKLDPATQQKLGIKIMGPTAIPVPVRFEKGSATLVVIVDPMDTTQDFKVGRVINAVVIPANGEMIWFVDPDAAPAAPATGPGGP